MFKIYKNAEILISPVDQGAPSKFWTVWNIQNCWNVTLSRVEVWGYPSSRKLAKIQQLSSILEVVKSVDLINFSREVLFNSLALLHMLDLENQEHPDWTQFLSSVSDMHSTITVKYSLNEVQVSTLLNKTIERQTSVKIVHRGPPAPVFVYTVGMDEILYYRSTHADLVSHN